MAGLDVQGLVFVDQVVSTLADGKVVRMGNELLAHDLEGDRYCIPGATPCELFEWICGVIEVITGENLVRDASPDRIAA